MEEKKSLILDGTGSNCAVYREIIEDLRARNYTIELIRCEVDLASAKRRVIEREKQTGRHVSEEFVEFSHLRSARHFPQLATLVDACTIVR